LEPELFYCNFDGSGDWVGSSDHEKLPEISPQKNLGEKKKNFPRTTIMSWANSGTENPFEDNSEKEKVIDSL
jgi:hypothetical protein